MKLDEDDDKDTQSFRDEADKTNRLAKALGRLTPHGSPVLVFWELPHLGGIMHYCAIRGAAPVKAATLQNLEVEGEAGCSPQEIATRRPDPCSYRPGVIGCFGPVECAGCALDAPYGEVQVFRGKKASRPQLRHGRKAVEKDGYLASEVYHVGYTLLSESFPASWRTSVPLERVDFTLGLKLRRGDQSPTRPHPCYRIHEPFCNHSAAGMTLREDEGLVSGRNHPSEIRPLGKQT